jgi:isoleucyl-tRNA synthetase
MVLAEDGRKMSKRLQNYPNPMELVNTYGADAIRLTLIASPAVRAEDLCFSEEAVKHALRHLLLPWWNAYSFFVMYARIDGWTPDPGASPSRNLLDRWILSSLETLTGRVVRAMDVYDLQRSVQPFIHFIEDLTNWYIRRSRRRFWKSTDDDDKRQAHATLYQVLLRLCQIAAPFVPFLSDAIYRNLRTPDLPGSVHLCDFPEPNAAAREPDLEDQMQDVIAVVTLGRALRSEHKVKVRQPLRCIHVACRDAKRLRRIEALREVILDELNVNEAEFRTEEADWVSYSAKADFRRLGPRLGKRVQTVAGAIRRLGPDQCETLLSGQSFTLDVDGESFEIEPEDVEVKRLPRDGLAVGADGDLVVALELELTPALIQEGLAREFNNKVQNMRKAAELEVTQRIRIEFAADAEVVQAVDAHREYIRNETLADEILAVEQWNESGQQWDLNGHNANILIETV